MLQFKEGIDEKSDAFSTFNLNHFKVIDFQLVVCKLILTFFYTEYQKLP